MQNQPGKDVGGKLGAAETVTVPDVGAEPSAAEVGVLEVGVLEVGALEISAAEVDAM